jgi:serine/threonine protein phosphatase 1
MGKKIRYAIADIHGNGRAFLKLLDHVDPDPEEMVICGDLINRGLESWEVIEECSLLLDEGCTIIQGNHDYWYKMFRLGHAHYANIMKHETVGGMTTLRSFDLAIKKHGEAHVKKTINKVFNSMVQYLETDTHIFVHAGIDCRIPYMEDQKAEVLMMGCDNWKNPNFTHTFDQTIVFGHTPTPRIHRNISEEEATVWFSRKAKKLGIDTGAGFGWRLTMVDLKEGVAYAYDFVKRDIIKYDFMFVRKGDW